MTEMAPEQPVVNIQAGGEVDPEKGLTIAASLPGAQITLEVTNEEYDNGDNWIYLVNSFPQAADQVMIALQKIKDAEDEQEDIDDA